MITSTNKMFYVTVITDWYGNIAEDYVAVYESLTKAEGFFNREARASEKALAENPREEWGGHELSKVELAMYSCYAVEDWDWVDVRNAWMNPGYYDPEEEDFMKSSIKVEDYTSF
jgi:hypothetical protein